MTSGSDRTAPDRVPRIGLLWLGPPGSSAHMDAFEERLRDLGYTNGQDVILEPRYAAWEEQRLGELANELVGLPVDILVAGTSAAVAAAQGATRTIPIVMIAAGDPVGNGFVESLARPGGNITGVAAIPAELHRDQLDTLLSAFPDVSHVALLWSRSREAQKQKVAELQDAAQQRQIRLDPIEIEQGDDVLGKLEAARQRGMNGLLAFGTPAITGRRADIIAFVDRHTIPAVYAVSEFVEAGGLLARGMSITDSCRRAADYVDQILKGANPAELGVDVPGVWSSFDASEGQMLETLVNARVAREYGYKIAQSVVDGADRLLD